MKNTIALLLFVATTIGSVQSQNAPWFESMRKYGMEEYYPADMYQWGWAPAVFLNSVKMIHENPTTSDQVKANCLAYIKAAMDNNYDVANGEHPNAVASGHGMAFLARVTKDEKYLKKAMAIYEDYLKIPRAANGGVSHRPQYVELWDDTVYMVGMFLLEMYRLTGDEKYLEDLLVQIESHSDKLADKKWGLWVHGWDADQVNGSDCCMPGWADNPQRRSTEFWGRGNGWIGMILAETLSTIEKDSKYWKPVEKEFQRFMKKLPGIQDEKTGLWYQLPIYPEDAGNYLESSGTSMFAYSMALGLKLGVLNEKKFKPALKKAMENFQEYCVGSEGAEKVYPVRVCEGTCIGDKDYYYKRNYNTDIAEGVLVRFAYGSFLLFGNELQNMDL